MNSPIRTYADLVYEKERLEALLALQKEVIRKDIVILREELQPTVDLLTFLSKITTKTKGNSLLTAGIDIAGDLILKNILLAKSGWMVRLILPYFIKNYSTHELAKNGSTILSKIVDKFKRQ